MFAGHLGAALALGRSSRRTNLGWLIVAALALDVILWVLVLAGIELAVVPADYARRHYLVFSFPYSHGLAASIGWSLLAAGIAWMATSSWPSGRGRAAVVVAAAVFSHWLLDALVHGSELPILGSDSRLIGLGLWDHLGIALALESAIALLGLVLFLAGSRLPRGRMVGLVVLVVLVTAMTIIGMTMAPAPADGRQAAVSSLVAIPIVAALGGWLGSGRRDGKTRSRSNLRREM